MKQKSAERKSAERKSAERKSAERKSAAIEKIRLADDGTACAYTGVCLQRCVPAQECACTNVLFAF